MPRRKNRRQEMDEADAKPENAVRTLLEVLLYRGYMPDEIVGVSEADVHTLRHTALTCDHRLATIPDLSTLPVDESVLRPHLIICSGDLQPVIRATLRPDGSCRAAARVSGCSPGEVVCVYMLHGLPSSKAIPAAQKSSKSKTARKTKHLDKVNTEVARRFAANYNHTFQRAIFVTVHAINNTPRNIFNHSIPGLTCEYFTFLELQRNILRHALVPTVSIFHPYMHELIVRARQYARGARWAARDTPTGKRKRHRGCVSALARLPVTSMGDPVRRLLAIPAGTILRMDLSGQVIPFGSRWTLVAYIANDQYYPCAIHGK